MRFYFLFTALLFLLLACQDSEKPYRRPAAEPPIVSASPRPGAYSTNELQVEIRAPSKEFRLWFALDQQPDAEKSETFYGSIQLTLRRSGQIRVLVADPTGHIWGPFNFAYVLNNVGNAARCSVVTGKSLLKAAEPVAISVHYLWATELDRLYLSLDGVERQVSPDELDEQNVLTLAAGPWARDGIHAIGCRIAGPQPFSQNIEVTVDATPPSAGWLGDVKAFGRADWPVSLRLWAADAKSGLADVVVCSATGCIAPMGLGDDVFQYASAFTEGTRFQVAVTAAVRDQVGNVTLLDPVTFGIDFDEPPNLPLSPIASTSAAVISIYDYLPVPEGTAMEIRRLGDLATGLSPGALVLEPGWNDFIFQREGKTGWESFAIYRLGVHMHLPGAGVERWLVYASNSTLPAFNGWFLGEVPGTEFFADWWSIPHLWFVRDADGDGAWGQADTLCAPGDDNYSGPWAREALPWSWQAQAGDCQDESAYAPEVVYRVSCFDCANTGRLFMQARHGWSAFPSYHGSATAVAAASLLAGADVTFPAQTEPMCLFFWDENDNALADGQDPRVFAACDAASFQLSRRNGALRAAVKGGSTLAVEGIAYGGEAWATLVLKDDEEIVSRRSLGTVKDLDGVGKASLSIPTDIPPVWPWSIRVTDAASAALPTALPVAGAAGSNEKIWVQILNDYGLPLTTEAAVLLKSSYGVAGGMYSGDGQLLPVPVSSLAWGWSGLALREGFVSVAAPVAGTDVTLYILSQLSAGLLAGQVIDSREQPVPFANISWDAPPYSSRAVADADGNFTIPALGLGSLWVEGPEPGQAVSQFFQMESYSHVSALTMRLPGKGENRAVGLAGDAGMPWIKSEEPVEAITLPPFYHAALTTGSWTQVVGQLERRFIYPGFLPSYLALSFQTVSSPPSLGAEMVQYVACGDRLQQVGMGTTLQIDAPCWRWYAETGYDQYFLGNIDGSYAVDTTERFGNLKVEVYNGEGDTLILSDRLWGRTLRLALRETPGRKLAESSVAVGTYDVLLENGTRLVDGDGKPAVVAVLPGFSSFYSVHRP